MESEILNLQKRVAQLEAALAEMSQERRRRWFYRRAGLTMLVCTVVGAVAFAFTFSATAQGPSKVTAPFQVVDNHGKALFSVWADPQTGSSSVIVWNQQGRPAAEISATAAGNGLATIMRNGQIRAGLGVSQAGDGLIRALGVSDKAEADLSGDIGLFLRNTDGQPIAAFGVDQNSHAGTAYLPDEHGSRILELGRATGSDKPDIQILRSGNLKLGIGTSKDDDGLMVLNGGKSKTNLIVQGTGILQADNKDGKTVVSLGVSGFGGGDLHLRNSSATNVVGIFSEQGNTGIAQFFDAAGQERVTMGTAYGGKGDVCVSGNIRKACLGPVVPPY